VTPALRTARLAQQFLAAALKIQRRPSSDREAQVQRPSLVAYYLVGHAIELGLKSYLYARGLTVADLRRKSYGHQLKDLLAECRRRRIGRIVRFSPAELRSIRLLGETYAAKELEYMFGGSRTFPPYAEVVDLADRLAKGVFGYADTQG